MCGISGIHERSGEHIDPSRVTAMGDALAHRGPDDQGQLLLPGIAFGFRRLSIIDIEGGHQPMSDELETCWVELNGEIYNYRELRRELVGLGRHFRTESDTEVIVHGYLEWGLGVLDRLNGMFAFALWDTRDRSLVVARDHLGIKPVYYHDDGRSFRFGSEIRAILTDPAVPRELDPDALRILLHFGYLPSPYTPLRGVHRLRPGHCLVSNDSGFTIRRYWNPDVSIDHSLNEADALEQYLETATSAVRRQMVSDVPVGCLLSGGVDSAMVLAAAGSAASEPIQTFTAGFGGEFSYDEAEDAAKTADLLGCPNLEVRMGTDDFFDNFENTILHLEEPVLSQSTFAFHLLTAEVANHVKVVLTGQGADEPWAGYDRYIGERYGARARWLFGSSAAAAVAEKFPPLHRFRRATAALGYSDPVRRFAAIHQVFSPKEVVEMARGELASSDAEPEDLIRYWQQPVAHLDEFSQLLHIDTRMSLPDDLLLYGDKLSMANSVEARVPLLDRELIDLVESLPPAFKLRRGKGKYLHKRAAERLLPRSVVHRKKLGFATPLDRWFAQEMVPMLERTVLAPDSHCCAYLDRAALSSLLEEHRTGTRNNRRQLTLLLSFELSTRHLLSGAGVTTSDHRRLLT